MITPSLAQGALLGFLFLSPVTPFSLRLDYLNDFAIQAATYFTSSASDASTTPSNTWGNPSNMVELLSSTQSEPVQDRYIFVLKEEVDLQTVLASHMDFLFATSDSIKNEYTEGIKNVFEIAPEVKGYYGHFDEETVEKMRSLPEMDFVERDQVMRHYDVEHGSPWGLGRIAHRKHPSTSTMHDYLYDSHAGKGVWAYIIDTGVNIAHKEFNGRAWWGATIPEGDPDEDGNGHGTHVAGTVGGTTYGVAKEVEIIAIKVLRSSGAGTLADVIKGIEWAVRNHTARMTAADTEEAKKKIKAVANMSLGGGRSRILDRAVDAAVKAGIHFAVAAGNDDAQSCDYSPAASEYAITVGATTITDGRAWFSNWGKCVDVFAPGHQILSSWIGSNVATNTISGTSMASPHVAGLLALFLSEPKYANLSTTALKDKVIELSTKGLVTGMPTRIGSKTKNRLIFSDPPEL